MRLGLWLDIDGTAARTSIDAQSRLVDLVATSSLIESVWIGQSGQPKFPSPLIALSAIAGRWDVQVGTASVLLPSYHPVKLAEDAAVLSSLTRGNFTLGVTTGKESTWLRYGLGGSTLSDHFDAYVEMLTGLWSGREQHEPGTGTALSVPMGRTPIPPLWIGGHVGRAINRAARYGDGLLLSSRDSLHSIENSVTTYERSRQQGLRQGRGVVSVNRFVLVRGTADQAWRDIPSTIGPGLARYGVTPPGFGERSNTTSIVGTVNDARAALIELSRAGVDHLVIRLGTSDTDPSAKEETLRLLLDEVLPGLAETP